jgi:catechol 2,3-dioxygenase-like lactoylglutathione lyase family enzyme
MIDHITLRVKDFAKSKAFFTAALAPLGYEVLMEFEGFAGMGAGKKPDFWLAQGRQEPAHIAFRAKNHAAVHLFHEAALVAGAKDNGGPGPRAEYHVNYYGAFVIDPDGHNIEACCHDPE